MGKNHRNDYFTEQISMAEDENGTGLGLPVCYSIAARHNAKIEVETGPNGTTFSVRFNPN